jgi:hypothetical protein
MSSPLVFLLCVSAVVRLLRSILNDCRSLQSGQPARATGTAPFTCKRLAVYLITLPLILILGLVDAIDELWQYILLSRNAVQHIIETMIKEATLVPKDLDLVR